MVINTSNIPELLGFTDIISEAHIHFSYKIVSRIRAFPVLYNRYFTFGRGRRNVCTTVFLFKIVSSGQGPLTSRPIINPHMDRDDLFVENPSYNGREVLCWYMLY